MADATQPSRRVLYLAPGFMAYRVRKHVRGVQVFDIQLIRRLVALGVDVSLLAESSWKPRLKTLLGDLVGPRDANRGLLEIIWTPTLRKPLWNGLYAAARLRLSGRRWDAAYVGNAGEGLATAVGAMLRLKLFPRFTLLAHRYPKHRMIGLLRRWPSRSLAVSRNVEYMFPADLSPRCEISFGEMDYEKFVPLQRDARADGLATSVEPAVVNFVVLGALDTPLKDIPTAIKAFTMLPDAVRARCHLHLASFAAPPIDLPPGITAYPWMPMEDVPTFLQKMDVLMVTSLSETFCLALVQGMLTGLPAIVRDIGTLTDKTKPGGGLAFQTVEQLRDHMLTLANNPALRASMGRAGRETALAHYIWDTRAFVEKHLFPTV